MARIAEGSVPHRLELAPARPEDLPAIRALLAEVGLPADDVGAAEQVFLVASDGGGLAGCIGLEIHGESALLRSFAVSPQRQGKGIGRALSQRAIAEARARGVADLYLLTTTVEELASRAGFVRIDRAEVPEAVRASAQFRTLCSATAACMVLRQRRGQPGASQA